MGTGRPGFCCALHNPAVCVEPLGRTLSLSHTHTHTHMHVYLGENCSFATRWMSPVTVLMSNRCTTTVVLEMNRKPWLAHHLHDQMVQLVSGWF